jgi:hypothetical protein
MDDAGVIDRDDFGDLQDRWPKEGQVAAVDGGWTLSTIDGMVPVLEARQLVSAQHVVARDTVDGGWRGGEQHHSVEVIHDDGAVG